MSDSSNLKHGDALLICYNLFSDTHVTGFFVAECDPDAGSMLVFFPRIEENFEKTHHNVLELSTKSRICAVVQDVKPPENIPVETSCRVCREVDFYPQNNPTCIKCLRKQKKKQKNYKKSNNWKYTFLPIYITFSPWKTSCFSSFFIYSLKKNR